MCVSNIASPILPAMAIKKTSINSKFYLRISFQDLNLHISDSKPASCWIRVKLFMDVGGVWEEGLLV